MTHACYLLRSLNPRFRNRLYIGCTVDPRRRLKQHNGALAQGARTTKQRRPWEMLLCVYGFPSHVDALRFEWAWQHPLQSLCVRETAQRMRSLRGVRAMVELVCTMVALPKWNKLNLTLQFILSSLLQHRNGTPPLPPQMRLFVAPMDSLPGKDSEDGNDDNDDLSTCPFPLSDSELCDEDSGIVKRSEGCAVVPELGLSVEPKNFDVVTTNSLSAVTKGKKSRKGRTPPTQGRKGKRGSGHMVFEDPILKEFREKDSCAKTFLAMLQVGGNIPDRGQSVDHSIDSAQMTGGVADAVCAGASRQRERVEQGYLSTGERNLLFGLQDRSQRSAWSECNNQKERSDCSIGDLTERSLGEGILSHGMSKERSSVSRMKVAADRAAYTTSGSEGETDDAVEDYSYMSIGERILAYGSSQGRSYRPVHRGGNNYEEGIDSPELPEDLACKFVGERVVSYGTSKEWTRIAIVNGSGVLGDSGIEISTSDSIGTREETDEISEDWSHCSVAESILVYGSKGQSHISIVNEYNALGAPGMKMAAIETPCSGGGHRGADEHSEDLLCSYVKQGIPLCGVSKGQCKSPVIMNDCDILDNEEKGCSSTDKRGEIISGNLSTVQGNTLVVVSMDQSHRSSATGPDILGESRMKVEANLVSHRACIGGEKEWISSDGVCENVIRQEISLCEDLKDMSELEDSDYRASTYGYVENSGLQSHSTDSEIEEISLEEFKPVVTRQSNKCVVNTVDCAVHDAAGGLCSGDKQSNNGGGDVEPTRIGKKNVVVGTESMKVAEPQQKSLTSFWPVGKPTTLSSSGVCRKARNGDIHKILGDISNNCRAIQMKAVDKCPGVPRDFFSPREPCTVLIEEDDDEEVQEISASQFQQKKLSGKARSVCSLSDLR